MFEGRHVCERSAEEITSKGFMANVADVIVPHKDPTSEIIDPVHGSDAQALDAPQQIFESYQISVTAMHFFYLQGFLVQMFFIKFIIAI